MTTTDSNTPSTNHRLPHKDFYHNLRERLQQWTTGKGLDPQHSRYILLLPDLLHLLSKLILDHRISRQSRTILGIATAYILSPVDALPEGLAGPKGYLDDVVVAIFALNRILNEDNQQVVRELWAGEQDILELVQQVLKRTDELIGSRAWSKIWELFREKRS